jgi:phage shock protein A
LINAAHIHGLVKDTQDLMQKLKATEDSLGECEDRNAQLKNQNEELQRKLREANQKRKDTSNRPHCKTKQATIKSIVLKATFVVIRLFLVMTYEPIMKKRK